MLSQHDAEVNDSVSTGPALWFLSGSTAEDERSRVVLVCATPFRIGRRADLNLCLSSPNISKVHAEIIAVGDHLFLRDLQSTNGTFLNGRRVEGDSPIGEGDVLRFATLEFRVSRQTSERNDGTIVVPAGESLGLVVQFDRLMAGQEVTPHFQPVIAFSDLSTVGYEALARSSVRGLENPRDMFQIAERLNSEQELSRLCRRQGVLTAQDLPGSPNVFLNTHPAEKLTGGVLQSLRELRTLFPAQPLTVELHEAVVTGPEEMREFCSALRDLEIKLAYDDFGAGQARLLDLVKVPPDYLKFDISFIRGIHNAPAKHLQMVAMLVNLVRDFGTAALAEGVECVEEAEMCKELGFEYAQGYFFGKPAPAHSFQWMPTP